jgi:hypothetical protein
MSARRHATRGNTFRRDQAAHQAALSVHDRQFERNSLRLLARAAGATSGHSAGRRRDEIGSTGERSRITPDKKEIIGRNSLRGSP